MVRYSGQGWIDNTNGLPDNPNFDQIVDWMGGNPNQKRIAPNLTMVCWNNRHWNLLGIAEPSFHLYWHNTPVVSWIECGLFRLNTGGFWTKTTYGRIEQFAPISGIYFEGCKADSGRKQWVDGRITTVDYPSDRKWFIRVPGNEAHQQIINNKIYGIADLTRASDEATMALIRNADKQEQAYNER